MTTGKLGVWGPTFGLRWSAGSGEGARYRPVSPSRRRPVGGSSQSILMSKSALWRLNTLQCPIVV